MCDYRLESRRALNALPVPVERLSEAYPKRALTPLYRAVRSGLRPGRDLLTHERLDDAELAKGHYLTPSNFARFLDRANRRPELCDWCGERLPETQVREHRRPHDHREHIAHHHHASCWVVRLVAVALILGHIEPERLQLAAQYDHQRRLPARKRGRAGLPALDATRQRSQPRR
jgi:hypothetical protein